eukprot:3549657-Amphidinium_carterae.1
MLLSAPIVDAVSDIPADSFVSDISFIDTDYDAYEVGNLTAPLLLNFDSGEELIGKTAAELKDVC